MREITLRRVVNGFHVRVGCMELVFPSLDAVITELRAYHDNPDAISKKWQGEAEKLNISGAEGVEATDAPPALYRSEGADVILSRAATRSPGGSIGLDR